MTIPKFDVVVIGAGIVGAACAFECARREMKVAVLERSEIATGATATGMGHIVVMDDSDAQFALTRYSQQLWQRMRPDLPDDVEFEACGTIWVAADEQEMSAVWKKQQYYSTRGVPVEVLDPKTLSAAEPNLRRGLAGGLLVPGDIVVYPPCATRWLIKQAKAAGAQVCAGTLAVTAGHGIVQTHEGEEFAAEVIINATGVDAPGLAPGFDIKPRKGHLAITERYPGFLRHQLVELGYLKSAHTVTADSVAFNVQPRRTGQILVGSSRQYGAEGKEIEHQILRRMLERAQEYLPGLGEMFAVRTWTGFRAATPDKLPLIGPCPHDKTLFLAAGHEGLGITTSLGTAYLLADLITGGNTQIPIEPYLPARMAREQMHV